jgi:hypothetical protein
VQRSVRNDRDGLTQLIDSDVAPPGVEQIFVCRAVSSGIHPLQAGVRTYAMQAKQKTRPQHAAIHRLIRRHAVQGVGEVEPQIRLLEHVEEARHWPGFPDLGLECRNILGFRLRFEG